MKKHYLIIAFTFIQSLSAFSQTVSNDAELGNRDLYSANCWDMGAFTVSNSSSTLISGSYSLRSNQLTSESLSASWVKSPWVKLSDGNISFKTRLDGAQGGNRTIVVQYVPVDTKNNSTMEGSPVEFYRFEFPNPITNNTTVYNVTFPIPAKLTGDTPYKILFSFIGTGGVARAGMDDLHIPGTYFSDPAGKCLPIADSKDSDGDGVADNEDEYPEDPFRAFNNPFPAKGFGTLMFEDLWPAVGDYDFNDLVVDYRINRVTDAKNELVEAVIELKTRAIGAGFKNGFGIEFTGLDPERVLDATGMKISGSSSHKFRDNGLEEGTKWITLIPFNDANNVLPYAGGGVTGVNTSPGAPRQEVTVQKMVVTFKKDGKPASAGATDIRELGPENFNPFLIKNQDRGMEIHLPGKTPTALADTKYFGTGDDNTDPKAGVYYQSRESNLPWALHVGQSIPYVVEKESIVLGFLKFKEWVMSNGSAYSDWYLDEKEYRNNKYIY